jgi:hypothetical protein
VQGKGLHLIQKSTFLSGLEHLMQMEKQLPWIPQELQMELLATS